MSKQGFVQLHRKIQDHWLYQEERKFSKFEAWIDMIMLANHKENKFVLGNEFVHVERGQFITSIRKLEKRWNWSNTKVIAFLNLLQEDKMIDFKSDTKKTVITIDKYDFYHDKEKEKRHENDTEATQKHTNNNVKNVNKKRSPKQVYDESSDYYILANYFLEQIRRNNPNHKTPNMQKWSDDIRKMAKLDNRTEEQIKYLMKWVQEHDFWAGNVLSPAKLREKFDQLVIQVKKDKGVVTPIKREKSPEQIEQERLVAEMKARLSK